MGEELWGMECCACVCACVCRCGFLAALLDALLLDWTCIRRAPRLLARLRSSAGMLTYADVCRRMLTCADVCHVYSLVYTPPLIFEALLNFL